MLQHGVQPRWRRQQAKGSDLTWPRRPPEVGVEEEAEEFSVWGQVSRLVAREEEDEGRRPVEAGPRREAVEVEEEEEDGEQMVDGGSGQQQQQMVKLYLKGKTSGNSLKRRTARFPFTILCITLASPKIF